jgi:hypothetical protein
MNRIELEDRVAGYRQKLLILRARIELLKARVTGSSARMVDHLMEWLDDAWDYFEALCSAEGECQEHLKLLVERALVELESGCFEANRLCESRRR